MAPLNTIAPVSKVSLIRREYRDNSDTRRRSRRNVGANVAKRGAKVALKTGGAAVQTTGKGVTRVGAGLSSTGVGAIIGVPLVAVGGVMQGVGAGMKQSSRLISTSSNERTTRIGRYTVKFLKWTSLTLLFFWQIVLVGLFLGLLAMQTWSENATIGGAWDRLWNGDFGGALEEAGQSLVTSLIGGDVGVGLAVGAWAICLAITWFFLFVSLGTILMQKWCKVSNIQPLNTSRKEALFIVALVFYAMPVVQVIPWAWFWLRYLGKHGADTE